jgi:hypothetical protein
MEFLFELFFEVFAEIVLSILGETISHLLLWFGFRNEPLIKPREKSLSFSRGILLGILLGLISILIISRPLIEDRTVQVVNLFLSPLFIGMWTMSLGTVDIKLGKTPSTQDTFLYGAIFGFAFALTRLVYFVVISS